MSIANLHFFKLFVGVGPVFERIKALCAEKGITVQTLEIMSGLSNGTITHWRNSNPRVSAVYAIANVLNSTVEYIYTGEGPAHPQKGNISEVIAPENSDVAAYLQKVKDEEGIMFDLSKVASLDEIKATVAFLKTLRNQGRDSE